MRASNKGIVGKSSLWEQTAGSSERYAKNYSVRINNNKKWLYRPAYRNTVAEIGKIRKNTI